MGGSATPLLASLAAGCAGVLELLPLDRGGRGAPLGDGAPTGRPLDVGFDILEHPHWEARHQRLHQPPVAVGGRYRHGYNILFFIFLKYNIFFCIY